MAQEELDTIMAGDLDTLDNDEEKVAKSDLDDAATDKEIGKCIKDDFKDNNTAEDEQKDIREYKTDANMAWPPPSTEDHKMVSQLDDAAKDSEVKATQIFDKLDVVSSILTDIGLDIKNVSLKNDDNVALFEKLSLKFPNIKEFKKALDDNREIKEKLENITRKTQNGEDEVMMAMDIMQYQDIHKQKIERVINIMRALSKYISLLFEGSIDDEKRVGSTVHIQGDEDIDDLVTMDDIEAIIESLGKRK